MTELCWLGVRQAAALVRQKALSPVELTQALLARIERYDSTLNSFITLAVEPALERAKQAEAAVMAGSDLGPLHGVPFALKDIIDVAGLPMTCHSEILKSNIAQSDAAVMERLCAAGGILIGKLATHEFALGGPAFDLPFPPARNPWDPRMMPGGSSSGAGAAVAGGLVPAAIGTDTGGSVRNPATCCGLAGIKATYGRVSRRGVFPLCFSLDSVGPLTRGVADNAAVLNAIAGHDPQDPGSAARPAPDFTGDLDKGVKGLRVGVVRHFYTRDLEAHADVVEAIEAALAVLADLGAEIVEIETTPLQDFAACNRIILLSEACSVHREWLIERPEDYSRMTSERLLPGLFLSANDYVRAVRWRRQLAQEFDAVMQTVDVAVTASSMEAPFPIDDLAAVAEFYPRQARTPFNVTGHPALSVPVGFDPGGLPLAMQVIGRHWDERTVYRVAHAYEQATEWHIQHPQLNPAGSDQDGA